MKLFNVDLDAPRRDDEVEYSNLALTRLVRRGLVAIALFAVVGAAANAGGTVASSMASHRSDSRITDQQDQIKGTVVGLCALPNLTRVFVVNFAKRLERLGIHTDAPPDKVAAAFKASYDELRLVDCKADLSAEDRLKICLQYPTTIPPGPTSAPPTTEYQPACET